MVDPNSVGGGDDHDNKAARCQIRLTEKAELHRLQAMERAADKLFPAGRLPDPDDVMPLEELTEVQSNGLLLVVVWAGAIATHWSQELPVQGLNTGPLNQHDSLPEDFFCQPADIAEEVFHVAHQPRSVWSFDVEIRPFAEKW